jgi:thiosulfate dehydrogenase (quinone) large subunit
VNDNEVAFEREAEDLRPIVVGFLLIQIAVGYEWLVSGLAKILNGGFPTGLAAEMKDRSVNAVAWYARFLDRVVIPHGVLFGYLVEWGELLVGIAMISTAVLWLWRWRRLSSTWRYVVLIAIIASSAAAIVMNINFHLANGASHPWLIPKSVFDEGVDFDSVLPIIEALIIAVAVWTGVRLRRHSDSVLHQDDRRATSPLHPGR